MKRYLLGLALSVLTFTAVAENLEMGLATGRQTGTYYQFGQDISRLVAKDQIQVNVLESQGSVDNLLALWDRRSVQLAISQSDVLFFMAELGDEKTRRLVDDFRVVMPLYLEEAHLLARENIKQLSDLEGKRVAIGEPGSGTAMSAEIFLKVSQIQPSAGAAVGGGKAIEALKAGEIDALFYVAGSPVRLLQERVSADDGLHLVPVASEELSKLYGPMVTIPAGTYAWQTEALETIGIEAALMTLAFAPENAECASVRKVSQAIVDGLDWLKQKGHEKWGNVDLEREVAEGNRSACSAIY